MNRKRIIAAALLAVMISLPALSLAQEVRFEAIMQYMPGISSAAGSKYVIVTGKDKLKAVFSTEGEQLSPYQFKYLAYQSMDYFIAYNKNGDNTRALMDVGGTQLTDMVYGGFKVYSRKWAVAYTLSPTDKANSEFKRSKEYFTIDRYDLFYLGGEPSLRQPVAQLTKDQIRSVGVHGDFIALKDADGKITLHDKDFSVCEMEMKKVSTPVYAVDEYYAVVNLVTGQQVTEGVLTVKEMETDRGLRFLCTRYNFKGQKVSVISDEEGNEEYTIGYTVSSLSGDYAVVTGKNKLKGLYSLSQGKLIVPCEYSGFTASKVSTDPYVHNGYVAVESGGLRGYVDTRTGEVSCEFKYDPAKVTTVGCSTFWKVENGVYMLAAADGVETEVHVDSIYEKTRGNGYLLIAQKDGFYGVIDWHGQEVLPFIHSKIVTITDNSAALLRTSTGVEMDRIVIDP